MYGSSEVSSCRQTINLLVQALATLNTVHACTVKSDTFVVHHAVIASVDKVQTTA